MTTTSSHNNQKAGQIVSLLRKSYARLQRRILMAAILGGLAVVALSSSLLIVLESGSYFEPAIKSVWITFTLVFAVVVSYRLLKQKGPDSFAAFYQHFFEQTGREELYNAIDLWLDENQHQSRFYQAAIRSNTEGVDLNRLQAELASHLSKTRSHRQIRWILPTALAGLSALLCLGVLYQEESSRAFSFWEAYQQPNPFEFTVAPGDSTIEHGSAFRAAIEFPGGRLPDQLTLAFRTDVEEEFRRRPMRPDRDGRFVSDEIELTSSIEYRVEMDRFSSPSYRLDVQLQPRFEELIATITPPAYTGLPERRHEYPFSGISLYPGSALKFEATANKPLESLTLLTTRDSTSVPALSDTASVRFETELHPREPDTLRFRMEDKDGLTNQNPFRTEIAIREDQRPSVIIQQPTGTLMEPDPGLLQILYQATDDFGITRAELHWELRRAFVDEPVTGEQTLDTPRNGRTEQAEWDLSEIGLRPRDELSFRIRVWDNDEVSGYKWGESQAVTIQVPSLADYFEDLDSRERDVQGELDQISDNFRNMEQEYEEFLERLRQNPEGGFEEEQMLEEIRERQGNVDESIKELNEQFDQIRSEMQQSDRISEETRRAYDELQQLMEELDDPSLREAMEELQRALERMSPEEIEQALENVDFNENLYRERIDRTVELLKHLKMNSDLDRLASQYEDLSDRTAPSDDQNTDQLNRELETVESDLESLERQLENLDANPPRRAEEQLRQIKESAQRELESIRGQLDELQEQTSGGGEGAPDEEVQNQQQQISQKFGEEAEKMRSGVSQMGGQQINVNILALQRALYTLLELSDMQEYITQTASETRNRSQGFVDLARNQNNVSSQFSAVGDTLFQVSSELPGVPNQVNRKKADVERTLSRSIDAMVERNQQHSSVTTREALGGINDLTSMVASLIDQLMDQQGDGGGGGMSMQQMVEQLQNMSGDQQQLNEQLQEMINDMQGDRLTREESERLDQLARQQNEIRRQLQEMQQRGALNQGDRTLSEMQRMIEDMEESINEMRGGVTDPLMVRRQQNILSRMLDAEESLQQRGESEEREGTASTEYDRTLPPEMTLEELQQEIRSRLQDPNYTRFSEQYQRLIEQYFDLLRRFEDRPLNPRE
jgi:hypothetical protein